MLIVLIDSIKVVTLIVLKLTHVSLFLLQQLLDDLNHMLTLTTKLFLILSGSFLLQLLSTKLCDSPPDFLFSIYYYTNIARMLMDLEINTTLLASSVKFPMSMVIYKLASPPPSMFFNFNKFLSYLDKDVFKQTQIFYHANVIFLLLLIYTTIIW